jgi:hypothetical protein
LFESVWSQNTKVIKQIRKQNRKISEQKQEDNIQLGQPEAKQPRLAQQTEARSAHPFPLLLLLLILSHR